MPFVPFTTPSKYMVIRSINAPHGGFPIRNRADFVMPAGYECMGFANTREELKAICFK